jgi:uncharacterized protein
MVQRCRQRWFVLLLVVLGCVFPATGETVKSMPDPTNYVNDYTGVLNESTKTDLDNLLHALDTQAHAQVFVAVIKKIDDDSSPAEFANELFAKWKPGGKGSDRGVLLLVSVGDRKYQFEVGYGLEGILPDAKVGDIGRDMVPDLRSGSYNGAVRTAVNEVSDVIAKDANVTLDVPQQQAARQGGSRRRSGGGASSLVGILVFLFILFLLFRGGGRGGRGGGPGGLLTGMVLGNMLGGRRGRGDDWGGGGFGGGSWGGGGGGGGGFGGGGGGSSGGGGAGGGW